MEGWDARNGLQSAVDFSLLGISVVALANLLSQQMMPGSGYRAAVWVWLAVPLVAGLAAGFVLARGSQSWASLLGGRCV